MVRVANLLTLLGSLALAQETSDPTPPKGTQINAIPIIGLGTARMSGNTSEAVATAIQNGFRHIDCAFVYGNQKDVGAGIKEGLKRTGLSRKDLWVTSKLGNNRHGNEEFAIQETLNELGLDYLDLFLVHWPMGYSKDAKSSAESFDYLNVWKGMEKLVRPTNGTRFIGISNFSPSQVDDLLKVATIKPKVQQIELHPYLQQTEFVEKLFKNGITVTAYAPLGNTNPMYQEAFWGDTGDKAPKLLSNPVIMQLAKDRGCSPAQVALGWNVHRRVVVIPKASRSEHQKENLATYEKCKLSEEDITKINKIGIISRMVSSPCKGRDYTCFEGLDGGPYD